MPPPTPLPTKPSRTQLRQQARTLDAFGPASQPVDVAGFVKQSQGLASAYLHGTAGKEELGDGWDAGLRKKDKERLAEECSLDDLIAPVAGVYGDPNLISGLKVYQHELATPYGSLHAIHALDREGKEEVQDEDAQDEAEGVETRPKKRAKTAKGAKGKGKAVEPQHQGPSDDIAVGRPGEFDPAIDPALQDAASTSRSAAVSSEPTTNGRAVDDDGDKSPTASSKPKRVRKKKAGPRVPLSEKDESLRELVYGMQATGLKMLQSTMDARFFVRSVGRPDINILAQMKYTSGVLDAAPADPPVLLTITFHPVVRSAVLAPAGSVASVLPITSTADHKALAPRLQTLHILSSQTLAQLKDTIACPADFIPVEVDKGEVVFDPQAVETAKGIEVNEGGSKGKKGEPVGPLSTMMVYRRGKWKQERWDGGAVFCIEGKLYGDRRGLGEVDGKVDYAELVTDLLKQSLASQTPEADQDSMPVDAGSPSSTTPKKRTLTAADIASFEIAGKGMEETRFDELELKIGEPYWMFHQGSCEHVWTVDEIRCLHPDDPSPFPPPSAPPRPNRPEPEEADGSTPRRRGARRRVASPKRSSAAAPTMTPSDSYPITTFLSRSVSAKCRICDRDPASMVVVDDELCGDSPCYVCERCFELLHGHEDEDEEKVYWVVPLLPET